MSRPAVSARGAAPEKTKYALPFGVCGSRRIGFWKGLAEGVGFEPTNDLAP